MYSPITASKPGRLPACVCAFACVPQVIKLLYEKTFSRPAPRGGAGGGGGAGDTSRKSLNNSSDLPAARAQSAEPSGVGVGVGAGRPRAATPASGGDALISSYAAASSANASTRLGRPSSAPHRQDDLRPPTWPGNDVSGQ
jgi:hypothetical protein